MHPHTHDARHVTLRVQNDTTPRLRVVMAFPLTSASTPLKLEPIPAGAREHRFNRRLRIGEPQIGDHESHPGPLRLLGLHTDGVRVRICRKVSFRPMV